MASSEIEICNGGLLMLGDITISDFKEETTTAKLCSNLWPFALSAVLRLHPWNCAVKRIKLAPDATAPVYEYGNAFTLPAECLRLLEVYGITKWKVEGRKILTDATGLNIKYVFRNVNVPEYDALLVETLQSYMAFKLSYPITKSSSVQAAMFDVFKALLPLAKNIDAQEEPQDTFGDFPFISVRG